MTERTNEENATRVAQSVDDVARALHRIADSFERVAERAEVSPEEVSEQATKMISQIFESSGLAKLLTPNESETVPTVRAAQVVERSSDASDDD